MIHHIEAQVLSLLLVACLVGIGARRLRLPYTLALVVAGFGLGFANLSTFPHVGLSAELLLLLLLPALLFLIGSDTDRRSDDDGSTSAGSKTPDSKAP